MAIKVFGIFVHGQFAPEIVAASSEQDSLKRAIAQGLVAKHEFVKIRQFGEMEIAQWTEYFATPKRISDRELCIDALLRIYTPEAEMMDKYIRDSEENGLIPLSFFRGVKGVSTKDQYGCWCALAIALARYKPSVQRDRILRDVEGEVSWLQCELRNEFRASMIEEVEEMEVRYAA